MRKPDVRLLVVAVVVGAACPALADTVFGDEQEFLRAAGSTSFESFEELPANDTAREDTIRTPGFTVQTRRMRMGIFSSTILGLHATHGSNYLVWDADPGQITFTFRKAITAFGLTLNDALDQRGKPRLSLATDGGAAIPELLVGPLDDAEERFVGIIADAPFTRLSIGNNTRDSVGLDGVHFGPIAEPGNATR